MRALIVWFIAGAAAQLAAQQPVVFTNEGDLTDARSHHSAISRITADINGDFRDDLALIDGDSIYLYLQINEGNGFLKAHTIYNTMSVYTSNLGDFNNDGINELVFSGFYQDIVTHRSDSPIWHSIETDTIENAIFAQGSSVFDINNDGWLDALITNDDARPVCLINEGNGYLVEEQLIDFNTRPVSDNSGNYSAIWVDLDNDHVQDLYIAKCRVNVDDPKDPRRINMAFLNEDGAFREAADSLGLALGEQSWCADSGDFDNDGDEDLIVINHGAAHVLMENTGAGFVRHDDFTDKGPILTPDLQVSVADFNNDGWLDIIIGGIRSYLLVNEGGLQFRRNDNPFGFRNASSVTVGDLNSDGYQDAFASYGGIEVPGVVPDEKWYNFGGANNYVKLSLSGTLSNRNGVGARVICFYEGRGLTRWVKSGTGYGITNSMNLHYGLGNASLVDSLVIYWPSGLVETHFGLESNTHYVATEGGCLEKIVNVAVPSYSFKCLGDSIVLNAPADVCLHWENGSDEQERIITMPGLYYSKCTETPCRNASSLVQISGAPDISAPVLNYADDIELCEGDILFLTTGDGDPATWQDGSVSAWHLPSDPGSYFAYRTNGCDTLYTPDLHIDFYPTGGSDTIIYTEAGGFVNVVVQGDSVLWYTDSLATTQAAEEGSAVIIGPVLNDTVLYYESIFYRQVPSSLGGKRSDSGIPDVGNPSVNGIMTFDVYADLSFESVKVYAYSRGIRDILIMNDELDTLWRISMDLEEGWNPVTIGHVLAPGRYVLTTDSSINMDIFDQLSPDLGVCYNQESFYPSSIGDLARVEGSSFGENAWFYFFDWRMKPNYPECRTAINRISIKLDTISSIGESDMALPHVYPNPAQDVLNIQSRWPGTWFTVLDNYGKSIMTGYAGDEAHSMDISAWPEGLYILNFDRFPGSSIRVIKCCTR